MIETFFSSFALSLSLIVPLGPQNSFVFRQGIRREHVFVVCVVCVLSDALLIAVGILGFDLLVDTFRWIDPVARYGGAAFLLVYGLLGFRSVLFSSKTVDTVSMNNSSLAYTLTTCLVITWVNPHVYLDTVLLLGSVSSQFEGQKTMFYLGAVAASCSFFFVLGYAARLLNPVFQSGISWKILDVCTALVMWYVAFSLVVD